MSLLSFSNSMIYAFGWSPESTLPGWCAKRLRRARSTPECSANLGKVLDKEWHPTFSDAGPIGHKV